jgi:EmrB/QacA subfamily drug resistance transporter
MNSTKNLTYPWLTFWLCALAVFLVSLDGTVVIAAYPALRHEFAGVSAGQLSWALNAYSVVYAALLVPAGRLADQWGRKRLFLWGMLLFTLASMACGLSPSSEFLIAARVIQAVGASVMTTTSLALILAAFPSNKRAAVVGLWSAMGAFAAAVGPGFGSWLIHHYSWRWIFLINLPIGIYAWLHSNASIAESNRAGQSSGVDGLGILLLIAGVSLIALGIVKTEDANWPTRWIYISVATGLAVLIGFVFWASYRKDYAIDLSLFNEKSYCYVNLASFVFGIAFTMMFVSSFLFLMGIWKFPQNIAGWAVTPGPLVVIPVAILSSRWAGKIGHRPLLLTGGFMYAASNLTMSIMITDQSAFLSLWLPAQIVGGIAVGLLLPALSGAAVAKLSPQQFGVGGGVNNAIRQMGGVIGVAAAVALVGKVGAELAQFKTMYLILASAGLLTALLCLPIDTRPKKSTE